MFTALRGKARSIQPGPRLTRTSGDPRKSRKFHVAAHLPARPAAGPGQFRRWRSNPESRPRAPFSVLRVAPFVRVAEATRTAAPGAMPLSSEAGLLFRRLTDGAADNGIGTAREKQDQY